MSGRRERGGGRPRIGTREPGGQRHRSRHTPRGRDNWKASRQTAPYAPSYAPTIYADPKLPTAKAIPDIFGNVVRRKFQEQRNVGLMHMLSAPLQMAVGGRGGEEPFQLGPRDGLRSKGVSLGIAVVAETLYQALLHRLRGTGKLGWLVKGAEEFKRGGRHSRRGYGGGRAGYGYAYQPNKSSRRRR